MQLKSDVLQNTRGHHIIDIKKYSNKCCRIWPFILCLSCEMF